VIILSEHIEVTDIETAAAAIGDLRERVLTLEESADADANCETFTLSEAARKLRVSVDTVRRLIDDPDVPLVGIKVSAGRVVIRRTALTKYLLLMEQEAYLKTKERNNG
jgi:excisionase family DNA binding protein